MANLLIDMLDSLPDKPGIYHMIDRHNNTLYVGKAKNLRKRVRSYVNYNKLIPRLSLMVQQIDRIEHIITKTEGEALLLEANLIKSLKPKYNIILRDSKTLPCIALTNDEYPSLIQTRSFRKKYRYFGPFLSSIIVKDAIVSLQKAFLIRTCSNVFFRNRKRPCILYDIKRCSAPCVNKISKPDYAELIKQIVDFLSGKSQNLRDILINNMEQYSANLQFEQALLMRNRLESLAKLGLNQLINLSLEYDVDVITFYGHNDLFCIQITFIRNGSINGNKIYYPRICINEFYSYIIQIYDKNFIPDNIWLSSEIEGLDLIEHFLINKAKKKIKITIPTQGKSKKIIDSLLTTTQNCYNYYHNQSDQYAKIFLELEKFFNISQINRIEIYDMSHCSGANALGVMVVFDRQGHVKNQYRRFYFKQNINDDYLMFRKVMQARFKKANKIPELMILDGGKGQLSVVQEVLASINIDTNIIAMSKGKNRNAGQETYYYQDRVIKFTKYNPIHKFMQNMRDAAHNFAINSHRKLRNKKAQKSFLDAIQFLGAARKQQLIMHFGSVNNIFNASLEDLAKVKGVGTVMAQKIYDYFQTYYS